MKSCKARWNPRKLGWNLRCITSDEIKSASPNLPQGRFHSAAISSTKWIYSDEGGFNWKRLRKFLSLFLVREMSRVKKTLDKSFWREVRRPAWELSRFLSRYKPCDNKNKDQDFHPGLYLVRETGLEPVHQRYTPLKRARLPIPPLPRTLYIIAQAVLFVKYFFKSFLSFLIFFVPLLFDRSNA